MSVLLYCAGEYSEQISFFITFDVEILVEMSSAVIIISLRGPNRVTKFTQSGYLDVDFFRQFNTKFLDI